MATRFYLDTSNSYAPVFVPLDSAWDYHSVNTLRTELLRSVGTTPITAWTAQVTESDAAVNDVIAGQFVSPPLTVGQSFSTSDTVTGYWSTRMSSSTYDFGTQLVIRVVSFDGQTTRATLYGPHSYTTTNNTAGAVDREFSSTGTHESRLLPGGAGTLTSSYTTVAGDRLVVEVGARACNVTATARTADPRFLTNSANGDFTVEGTGGTALNSWVELSPTLTFDTSYDPADGKIFMVGRSALVESATPSATVTPSTPSGTAVGDYVMVFAFDQIDAATLSMSGDWDVLSSASFAANGACKVWGTVWAGTESLAVSTNQGASGIIAFAVSYRNVDPVTPMDAAPVQSTSAASLTFTPTGITTVTDEAMVLSMVVTPDDNALMLVGGSEQGFRAVAYGENYDSTQGVDEAFGLADKRVAAAGAVTAPTWQQLINGTEVWGCITFALRPVGDQTVSGSAGIGSGQAFGSGGVVTTGSVGVVGLSGIDSPDVFGAVGSAGAGATTLVGVAGIPSPDVVPDDGQVRGGIEAQRIVFVGTTELSRWDTGEFITTLFSKMHRGYTLIRNGSTYTAKRFPSQRELAAADEYWLGGHVHELTEAQAAALTGAGYGAYVFYVWRDEEGSYVGDLYSNWYGDEYL